MACSFTCPVVPAKAVCHTFFSSTQECIMTVVAQIEKIEARTGDAATAVDSQGCPTARQVQGLVRTSLFSSGLGPSSHPQERKVMLFLFFRSATRIRFPLACSYCPFDDSCACSYPALFSPSTVTIWPPH